MNGRRRVNRRHRFVFGSLVTLLSLLPACKSPSPHPKPAATRDGRWRQDVEYLCDNLTRLHKDFFRYSSREGFEAARRRLLARIPELSDAQIMVELAALGAWPGDAHTGVVITADKRLLRVPLATNEFSDGWFIVAAPEGHEDWLGAKLVAIDDHSMDEVLQRLARIISHENMYWVRYRLPRYVRLPEVLHAVGVARRPDSFRLRVRLADGASREIEMRGVARDELPQFVTYHDAHPIDDLPPSRKNRDQNYWYEVLPGTKTVYFAHNRCVENPEKPFAPLAREVLDLIDDGKVDRLIFDLRYNGGGGEVVAWPLLRHLAERESINRRGGIFCLIGPHTFSSAKANAISLKKWTHAITVGRPIGNKPNSFGEVRTFRLPNSELLVRYSTKYFRRWDTDVDSLYPDIEAPDTFADWAAGRDRALEIARDWSE
ncbi:MAG: hypothetical protein D6744_01635 [Planctomycetota bacterium]|nr:MAG: hypothetical protein D6744_01635 [Planctomycetota bacterium]